MGSESGAVGGQEDARVTLGGLTPLPRRVPVLGTQ